MRTFSALVLAGFVAAAAPLAAQPAQPEQQNEFVPISEIPPEEQIPAPTMVGAAYGFAWVAMLGYVFLLVRRMGKVEQELAALERQERR
jgi:CcmD family protein